MICVPNNASVANFWGVVMVKQWKVAISLATIGAIAAPFVLGTYKMRPTPKNWTYDRLVPLTADEKENIEAFLKETKNCEVLADLVVQSVACHMNQRDLERDGRYEIYISIDKYQATNAAAVVAGFVSVFGMTFFLPALIRLYWRWLHE